MSRVTLVALTVIGVLLLVGAYVLYGYESRWVRQVAVGGLVVLGSALFLAIQGLRRRS